MVLTFRLLYLKPLLPCLLETRVADPICNVELLYVLPNRHLPRRIQEVLPNLILFRIQNHFVLIQAVRSRKLPWKRRSFLAGVSSFAVGKEQVSHGSWKNSYSSLGNEAPSGGYDRRKSKP